MTSITKALKSRLVTTQLCFSFKSGRDTSWIFLQDRMGAQHHGIWRDHSATRPPFQRFEGLAAMKRMKWFPWKDEDTRHMPSSRSSRGNSSPACRNQLKTLFHKSFQNPTLQKHVLVKIPILHQKDIWISRMTTATNSLSSADPPFPQSSLSKKRVQQTLLQPSSSRTCHGRRAPNQKNWGSKTGRCRHLPKVTFAPTSGRHPVD